MYEFRNGDFIDFAYENGEIRIDGGQGSGNYNHKGRKGQVGGSQKYSLNDYRDLIGKANVVGRWVLVNGNSPCGSNDIPNNWSNSEQHRPTHMKHLGQFNFQGTLEEQYKQYTKQAIELAEKEVDHDSLLGYCRKDGTLVRYDKDKNELCTANVQRGVITYFKPNFDYFIDNMQRDIKNGGYISE